MVKGWLTETANEIAYLGVQVHGGMGFIEETGAALVAQAQVAGGNADPFYPAKIATARYYAEHVLTTAGGLAEEVVHGGASALALPEEMLG